MTNLRPTPHSVRKTAELCNIHRNGRSAAAHFALMRSFCVVVVHPGVQVGLQFLQPTEFFRRVSDEMEAIGSHDSRKPAK